MASSHLRPKFLTHDPALVRLDGKSKLRSFVLQRLAFKTFCANTNGKTEPESLQISSAEAEFGRRFFVGLSSASFIALGGNLAGITSYLLGFQQELARSLRLDVIYPVGGFLRYLDIEKGFEFLYPSTWVADQRLLYRAAQLSEKQRSLDLPPLQESLQPQKKATDPLVAFGPPGTDGELNVSVVVAPTVPGFMLDLLGDAQHAGNFLLTRILAPEGSNRTARMLNAEERKVSGKSVTYYVLEYLVKSPTFCRHNITVYTALNGQLFTLNVQTPERLWPTMQGDLIKVAHSFKLVA